MSGRFSNPWSHKEHGFGGVLRWKLGLGSRDGKHPGALDAPAGRIGAKIDSPPENGWRVTWLGHASFLLQGMGRNLLIDPVFSDYCAPVRLPGLRRMVEPPFPLSDLPRIDAVLLTHSHYDHLDLSTLRILRNRDPEVELMIAEGHEKWIRGCGFEKVRELSWFKSVELFDGLRVTSRPAQHFTARTPFDRDRGRKQGTMGRCLSRSIARRATV